MPHHGLGFRISLPKAQGTKCLGFRVEVQGLWFRVGKKGLCVREIGREYLGVLQLLFIFLLGGRGGKGGRRAVGVWSSAYCSGGNLKLTSN